MLEKISRFRGLQDHSSGAVAQAVAEHDASIQNDDCAEVQASASGQDRLLTREEFAKIQQFRRTMKSLRRSVQVGVKRTVTAIAICATALAGVPLQAATYYWDTDGSTIGNSATGDGLGGTGTWDAATPNWWDGASIVAWPNTFADEAVFSGPTTNLPYTVTLNPGVQANGLSFLRSGYTLTGGSLALGGIDPSIHVNLAESVTIASPLTGSDGLTLNGGGTLRLTGDNSGLTGTLAIHGGSLLINSAAALAGTGNVWVTAGNPTPSNGNLVGFTGGSLVLDGTAGGFTVARDLNLEGRGPIGNTGAALLSLGDNTLTGIVTTASSTQTPTTVRSTRINSVGGTLTLAGTLNVLGSAGSTITTLGGINAAGVGNFDLTGVLQGSGTIEKAGGGTLFLNPTSTAGFTGTMRVSASTTGQQSTVRVTHATVGGVSIFGSNTGTTTSAAIDLNGGTLEFRNDGDLDFGALSSGKNVYNRAGSTIFTGPAAGGYGINGTTTFGTLQHVVSTTGSTATTTFNSRNGFGVTFSSMAMSASTTGSSLTNTLANSMGGNLTFTGNITLGEGNTASRPRTIAFTGNGNTVVLGSIIAGTDPGKNITKSGTGSLTIAGTATSVAGSVRVTAGSLIVTDFRSLNNNTAEIALGNGGTGGNLIIGGTGVAATAEGLTTSKTITLNTTTGSNSIYANQDGAAPVILNGAITKIGTATTGNLILGGTNTADNTVNVSVPAGTTGGLVKVGSGTWVLAAENGYTGTTTISDGMLKLRATGTAAGVLLDTNAVTFGSTNGFAGATLEYVGRDGQIDEELLGALAYASAGAHTMKVTAGAGGTASLSFANISTGGAGTLNIVGADFTNNKVTFAQVNGSVGSNGIITRSIFWNGADYAYREGGVLRAPVYGVDGGTATTDTGPLTASVNNQLTGSISTNNISMPTLKIAGSHTLTINDGQTLTLSGGVLATGGDAVITGGAAIANGTNAFVVRVNQLTDTLTLSTGNITGTGGMTKSGAGTLIIETPVSRTGTTEIAEGTVRLAGIGTLSGDNVTTNIRQGAVLDLNGLGTGTSIGQFNNMGLVTNSSAGTATLTIGNNNGTGTSYGVIADGLGMVNVTKVGTGAQNWFGLSTYTGVTTITGLVTVDSLADGGLASGIGASSNAAGNLVFDGGGLVYAGTIRNGQLTLGSASATTNRLFTVVGSGATLSSTATNNNAIIWSNFGAIVHGTNADRTFTFTGTSTGDNTFNPQINDSMGFSTSLTKTGAGQWNLGNTDNTYTGATTINEGILALNDNGALSDESPLYLTSTSTSSVAVLQMSGLFERELSSSLIVIPGTNTVTFGFSAASTTGGVGFAAHSGPLTVAIGGLATPTALTWGSGGFVGTGGVQNLVLNSTTALSYVDFRNAIDFGDSQRTINVLDNTSTGADFAIVSGVLSGTGGGLRKIGAGILRVTAANTYTGLTEVTAGTLQVYSLGHSGDAPNTATSVGLSGVPMTDANAIVLGNGGSTGGLLQYMGPGEISDRKIRLNTTTGGNQIHADGSGPLILTNVVNDFATPTGNKTLSLRGSNTAGNMITSQLTNDAGGGTLGVTVDGGATWILTNGGNSYTGTTTVSAGALGIGHDSAIGATLLISNGNVFAYGADRTLSNTVNLNNNATSGFIGDYNLTFTGTNNLTAGANNINLYNSVAAGKAVTFNGLLANLLTANRTWTLDGTGETVINGDFTTTTTFGVVISKLGDGTLTLGGTGLSNFNQNNAVIDVDRGTLKFIGDNAISSAVGAGGLNLAPELLTGDVVTLDLHGTSQTVNAFTMSTDGTVIIDNTSASAATFRFGANDSAINFGTGLGNYTVQNTGAGGLSLVKLGNTNITFASNLVLNHQGTTAVEGGSLTVASAVNGTTGLRVSNSGSALALSGGITAPAAITSVIVEGGASLSLLDGAGSQIVNLTNLQLGSSGGSMTTLNFNVGDLLVAGDELGTDLLQLLSGGTLSLFAGNQITLNLTDVGLSANQTYDLIRVLDGGLTTGPLGMSDWILGNAPGGFSSMNLVAENGRVYLQTGDLVTQTLYWRGLTDNTWNADVNNWSLSKDGLGIAGSIPGQGTHVVFQYDAPTNAAVATTLEQNFRINTLTFEASSNPVNTPISVTINPGTVATNRLDVAPSDPLQGVSITTGGPASAEIAAAFRLGADQTWHVADAASTLTFSGALFGEADVTKTGLGTVVLAGVADPTFNAGQSTDITLNAGTLVVTNVAALGNVLNSNLARVVVNTGSAYYYSNATAGTLPTPIQLNGGTLSGAGANHTYSGAVEILSASFINLADANGDNTAAARNITLSGPVSGSGSLTIDGNNTVSGGNQISGTLTINNAGGSWNGDLIFNRGTVTISSAASATVVPDDVTFNAFGRLIIQGVDGQTINRSGLLTLAPGAIGELQIDNVTSGQTAGFLVNQNGAVTLGGGGAGGTLRLTMADTLAFLDITAPVTLGGDSSISVSNNSARVTAISGAIGDGGLGYGLAVNDDAGGWAQTNGTLRLTGLNTFTGNITLAAGALEFNTVTNASGGPSALGNGTAIDVTGGSILRFIGATNQSTNRTITSTSSLTLTAEGTGGATITWAGAIDLAAGASLTLNGTGEGLVTGGFTQQPPATGTPTADLLVSGGTWTVRDGNSRVADDISVTAGTLTLENVIVSVNDDTVINGPTAVLNLNSTGVWTAINVAGTSSGLYARNGGVINLNADDVNGVNNAGGLDFIILGDSTAGAAGVLNTNTFTISVPRLDLGQRGEGLIGQIDGTGTVRVTGGDINLFEGTINANLASTGTTAIEKFGAGVVTLKGDNSGLASTGRTIVYDGTLVLDYTASNTTKVREASALELLGANLILVGNASAASSQIVGGLSLDGSASTDFAGAAYITMQPAAGQDLLLNLGAITRTAGNSDGTVRFNLAPGVQTATNGIITSTLNTNGLLGTSGYATVRDSSGTWFATNATNTAGGNIVAFISTAKDDVATWAIGDNLTDGPFTFTGVVGNAGGINSLRFDASDGSDVDLGPGGLLGIASGGILVTDNVAGSPSIVGGTLYSGVNELIITHDSAAVFEISSDIRVAQAFSKSGVGTLLLSGNNTFTDELNIFQGTLQVTGGNAIGDTSLVTLNAYRNTTLELLADETIGRLSGGQRATNADNGTVAVNTHTLSINQSGNTTYSGFFTGTGTIVLNAGSTGNLALANASTGFTGSVVVNGGTFILGGEIGGLNAASYTVNKGGALLIDNNGDSSVTTRIVDDAVITLNSADGAFSGETRPRGLVNRENDNNNATETYGELVLAGGASYATLEANNSGTTTQASLIASLGWTRNNNATFNVRGFNLGGTTGRRTLFKVADANDAAMIAANIGGGGTIGGSAKNVSIVPWAIGENLTGAQTDTNMGNTFLSYVDNRGFVPLNLATEYAVFAAAAAGDNVRESLTTDLTGVAGAVINSLILHNDNAGATSTVNVTGAGAGQTLQINSGALLFTLLPTAADSSTHNIVLGGFDSGITVGSTNEYIFHVVNPSSAANTPILTATINSPLTSSADITKSGRGTLILAAINTAGGGANKTTINEGILEIADLDNIGGVTGDLIFAGGTLRLGAGLTDDITTRTITFLLGGGTLDTNGLDYAVANSLGSGVGGFTKIGAGNLTLNAVTGYTGTTRVTAGTLTVGVNNVFGTDRQLVLAGGTLALGGNTITQSTVTTAGAAPAISGPGTISTSGGFTFGHTGDTTIDAVLAGAGGILKTQANVITLTGLNTYTGQTEIQAGSLVIDSIADIGGGPSSLGAPTNALDGVIRMGLGTTATALTYIGTGHSTDRLIALQSSTGSVTVNANGTGALVLGGAFGEAGGNKTLFLRGSSSPTTLNSIGYIYDTGVGLVGVNKADANTWVMTAANGYRGTTTAGDGTLRIDAAQTLEGILTLGSASTAGILELNGVSSQFGGMTVVTNSASLGNMLDIDAGQTLTIVGDVTIGANADSSETYLFTAGGGGFAVNNPGGLFQVGGATGSANENWARADFAGLSSFNVDLGTTGTMRIGDNSSNIGLGGQSVLFLATNSTIKAGTLQVAATQTNQLQTLRLGSGTTVLNVETLRVSGATRGVGLVNFAEATGTLRLRGYDDVSAAIVEIGASTTSTGNNLTGTIDLSGHYADLLVSTFTMASRSAGNGSVTATFTFDEGILDVETLNMATRTSGSGASTATVNLGDGLLAGTPQTTIDSLIMGTATGTGGVVTANLNISGGEIAVGTGSGTAINMANAATGRTVNSSISLTGGNTSVLGSIVRTVGAGTENAVITLDGGRLDLNGNIIGATGTGAINFLAQSGTLANLGELNGGGALDKTTSGRLIVNGVNGYTGATNVNAGTMSVNGTLSGAGTVTVATGATFNGNGSVAGSTVVNGTLSAGSSSVGDNGHGVGGMTLGGGSTWNDGASFVFDFAAADFGATVPTVGSTDWDFLSITGTGLTLTSGANYTLSIRSWLDDLSDYGLNDFDADQDPSINLPEDVGGQQASYRWLWVDTNGSLTGDGIVGGNAAQLSQFAIDTSMFNGSSPLASSGNFWVSASGGDLYINYSAVPEPSSLALVGLAGLGLAAYRRRKRQAAAATEAAEVVA
jgi:autotransporter-associated beta strand protein